MSQRPDDDAAVEVPSELVDGEPRDTTGAEPVRIGPLTLQRSGNELIVQRRRYIGHREWRWAIPETTLRARVLERDGSAVFWELDLIDGDQRPMLLLCYRELEATEGIPDRIRGLAAYFGLSVSFDDESEGAAGQGGPPPTTQGLSS